MNILYVVPDLKKVSGGPRTRISLFKGVFIKNGGEVIEKGNKLSSSLKPRRINLVYVESATNRISFIDVICLFFLRLYSKKVIVFIRDVYIELFPQDYSSFRGKITWFFNKVSNFYLTVISTSMVFPTKEMGEVFFEKNHFFPQREYADLPPGTLVEREKRLMPKFAQKIGILYLGSTQYQNSGFRKFINFAEEFGEFYNFFVLSGDKGLGTILSTTAIHLTTLHRNDIPNFIHQNNIAFALHTRPKNKYDDITFPIKVLDFISLQLPFFSERHLPLINLLSIEYDLFSSFDDLDCIHNKIQSIEIDKYKGYLNMLYKVSIENTYDKRYKKLLAQ
tara:strand:- start:3053 stop:4057 length:1005 start_codon:yes stop_codon:yes gene_type:complete